MESGHLNAWPVIRPAGSGAACSPMGSHNRPVNVSSSANSPSLFAALYFYYVPSNSNFGLRDRVWKLKLVKRFRLSQVRDAMQKWFILYHETSKSDCEIVAELLLIIFIYFEVIK